MAKCQIDPIVKSDACFFQKVAECINQSAKLLEEKSPDAALSALEIISEALSICPYSEKLLKMKAEALIVVCVLFTDFSNFCGILSCKIWHP